MKIIGYFKSYKHANNALDELKSLGYNKSCVDSLDDFKRSLNSYRNIAGTEFASSLSNLILNSGSIDIEPQHGPLASASPMVSGFGKSDELEDLNCRVIVDADESSINQINDIFKNHDGELSHRRS